MIYVAQESPLTPDAARLIDGSEAALRAVYPPEECFSFSAAQLDQPNISFLVARRDGTAIGCVALVAEDGYAEIKRLYVTADARGSGASKVLLSALEALAKEKGLTKVMLETGPALEPAVRLYRSLGYVTRGPFADYDDIPASLFMEKSL